ncbi:hypothetical protein EON82_00910 [bacterium]|nr:MAG: hypothetical protein EON82_00910 [bacterium]
MICPNCGHDFNGGRCPNCGRPIYRTFNRVAAVVVMLLLVIPSALVGACSAIGGIQSVTGPVGSGGYWIIFAIVGMLALAVFAGSLALFRKLWGD